MYKSTDNIKPIARDICTQQLSATGLLEIELDTAVDKFWHCVAAQLEAGLLDKKCGIEEELAAYRDWISRHSQPST